MKNKDEILQLVLPKVKEFLKNNYEEIEFNIEGSLTDSYKYLSFKNVDAVLHLLFEETYKKCNEN